jgi:hypothetical protein
MPPLSDAQPIPPWVLGDARLRDLKPELAQFAVDAGRTPKRILDAHPPDQSAQLHVDLRSPSPGARLPTPVAKKAGAVPTHERLGPDDGENLLDGSQRYSWIKNQRSWFVGRTRPGSLRLTTIN